MAAWLWHALGAMLRTVPPPHVRGEDDASRSMPQKITTGFRALVDAAEREIETLPAEEAIAQHSRDDVTFVDLRDVRELEREGRIPGAFHCPRGMLEFWIDPESLYHKPVFAETRASCSFAAAAGVRRSPRKPRSVWDFARSPISPAALAPGARPAARLKRRRKRSSCVARMSESEIRAWKSPLATRMSPSLTRTADYGASSKIRRKQARTWRSVSTTCACSAGKSGKSAARAKSASTPAFAAFASNALGRHSRKI